MTESELIEAIKIGHEAIKVQCQAQLDLAQKVGDKALIKREIEVGLNDRLAFVKHLFNDSTEDFNRVISQLNTIDSEERAKAFIDNMVKPDYDGWAGQEEYELRLIKLVERRFS